MDSRTGKVRQENSDIRRSELIQATLRVIARGGVQAATVRSISKEASVTQGLIRYYFETKDDLIATAYETFMADMVQTADDASRGNVTALKRLANFVRVSLEPPVTSHESVSVWVGFFEALLHNNRMTVSHKRSYDSLRLHLKMLIADSFEETGRPTTDQELRRLSIAANAVLDGLWLEGGAMPDAFRKGELVQIGLDSFSVLLSLELPGTDSRPEE